MYIRNRIISNGMNLFGFMKWNISYTCLSSEAASKMESQLCCSTTRKQSKFEQACENEASSFASLLPKLKNERWAAGGPIGPNRNQLAEPSCFLPIKAKWCSWGLQAVSQPCPRLQQFEWKSMNFMKNKWKSANWDAFGVSFAIFHIILHNSWLKENSMRHEFHSKWMKINR